MPATMLKCCIDGCETRLGLNTFPPLCDPCRERIAAHRAAQEASRRAELEAMPQHQPGSLHFRPTTPQERTLHRKLIKAASRAGALG